MATGFNPKDKGENDLIGNILSDGKKPSSQALIFRKFSGFF